MEDREPHGELRLAEVRVHRGELVRGAEGLVDDGAERERRDVRALDTLRTPKRPVRATLRLVAVHAERPHEHELLDVRHRRARVRAERIGPDRDAPPAAELETLLLARVLDPDARRARAQEDRREPAPGAGNERGGNRHQDAGAVAGAAIRGDGAPVLHAPEPLECSVEDASRGAATDVGDEADAA